MEVCFSSVGVSLLCMSQTWGGVSGHGTLRAGAKRATCGRGRLALENRPVTRNGFLPAGRVRCKNGDPGRSCLLSAGTSVGLCIDERIQPRLAEARDRANRFAKTWTYRCDVPFLTEHRITILDLVIWKRVHEFPPLFGTAVPPHHDQIGAVHDHQCLAPLLGHRIRCVTSSVRCCPTIAYG